MFWVCVVSSTILTIPQLGLAVFLALLRGRRWQARFVSRLSVSCLKVMARRVPVQLAVWPQNELLWRESLAIPCPRSLHLKHLEASLCIWSFNTYFSPRATRKTASTSCCLCPEAAGSGVQNVSSLYPSFWKPQRSQSIVHPLDISRVWMGVRHIHLR